MPSKKRATPVSLQPLDALFGTNEETTNGISEIAIGSLHPFTNHPFQVRDDKKMEELAESITQYGVLVPGIVRLRESGGYELVAGHRRKRACELAGLEKMPVIIKDLTDDEATVIMVDSNIQREELLISEKAFAYKMKYEALKRQGKRSDLTSCQVGKKLAAEEVSQNTGDSSRQILRYIHLTELIAKLLELADEKKLPFNTAVEISYLRTEEQQILFQYMSNHNMVPSMKQAKELKQISKERMLTYSEIDQICMNESTEKVQVQIPAKKLKQYFPDTYTKADELRNKRKVMSKQIGGLMAKGQKDEAEKVKDEVSAIGAELDAMAEKEKELEGKIRERMLVIPNIIDPSVPIGKDDSENVEIEKFGEPVVPDYEIPYHVDIMESFNGIDLDSARRTSGNGFYYLMGDIARLHSAILSYARDFMIDRGFTYFIPPYMIRSDVVTGVMSFSEMEGMMYKIEGEDLYLIGTSEHSMIGRFIDTIIPEGELPKTLTSYSPCFRKEVGAHGIEERGVYRIHQFEKQEMIVVCKPEDSMAWYDKLWQNSVDFFRSLDIPVRTLECCSGDLADLKVKSCDVEAWSPRQKKYFEVGSCSNLGDAQARRLGIRIKAEDGTKYFAHTLNNTVVAPPRMLIAFLENNLNADGTVNIPEPLRMYMGGKDKITK